MNDREMSPLQGLARLAAMIYQYLAAEAVEALGEQEGRALVDRAISRLGEDRGRRIRAAVDSAGLPPTLANMQRFYDLPIGQAWQVSGEDLPGGRRRVTYTYCPLAELWQETGASSLGIRYCDIDMAIVRGYNPAIKIERHRSLLQNDCCCVYEYSE